MAEYKLFINGELVDSSLGETVEDIGPATSEPIAQVPLSLLARFLEARFARAYS